ncbi:CBN-DHHC-1 protein [Caenorhabditis brenneri]|uniref:Palmitoyltransferase n=1 Tax=Caenorhabditis brenneri TaxID=135651 RepID=G0MB08_CAEBE|nr:CBN-DHHC-1 protein [Caenorhabditis brenneri]
MQLVYGADEDGNIDLQKKLKKIMPTQIQDIIATTILLVFIPAGLLLHFLYVLPYWYPVMGEAWVIRAGIIGFGVFNLYSNWAFMMKTGPNGKHSILPNVVKPGYKHCHSCHSMSPPRAHHCPVCDVCVLRRDHHCSFGGVCVGHFNQRYFVAAAVNLFLLTIPLVSYSWNLLNMKFIVGISFGNLWQVMLPHVAWIFGFISIFQFLHVLLFVFTFTTCLFAFYLVAAQAFCIYQGQTRIEYLMEVHAYQLGFFENLRQALGSRWPLICLSCFIPSPLPTDGLSFVTREMFNLHTKDL